MTIWKNILYVKEITIFERMEENLLNVQHLLQYIMNVQTLAAYMNTM